MELFDAPRKSWWERLTASDRDGPYVTYIRNVMGCRDEPLPVSVPTGFRDWVRNTPLGRGAAPPLLAPTGAAEVFQAGMSASRQPIGQIASPGFRVPFQEALLSEPSEIAVERPTVENWFK